jgi:dihydrofolate reductase
MFNKNLELIWAQSSNNIIGQNGKMPWHFKEDLAYFKKMTIGKSVIMGRKTWDGLYVKPLPNRQNIVITTKGIETKYNDNENVTVVDSPQKALSTAIFSPIVIGGAQIYNEFIENAEKLLVTIIHKEFVGDTYAPKIPVNIFEITNTQTIISENKVKLEFREYGRK